MPRLLLDMKDDVRPDVEELSLRQTIPQDLHGEDASTVAPEGINQAGRRGDDVILIDMAGRMQDNEPLMRALSKLIVVRSCLLDKQWLEMMQLINWLSSIEL
jgi:signal recognition particle GTPase